MDKNLIKKNKIALNIIFFIILGVLLFGIIFEEKYSTKSLFSLIMIAVACFRFYMIIFIFTPMQKLISKKNRIGGKIHDENPISKTGQTGIFKSIAKKSQELEIENKDLQTVSEQKTTLLANISHEVKTPLNGIIGLTDLLLQTELTEKQNDFLKKVKYSSNTLLETLEDMLLFAKVENGTIEVKQDNFDLRKSIENIGDIFLFEIRNKKIELNFDIDLNIPKIIKGDFLKIKQVLTNLIWNAVKFTEVGEIILKIKIINDQKNKITLEFSVKDTGIGMEEADLENIFSAFTQLRKEKNSKHQGAGLGLNISQKLIEAMGGMLTVKSKLGKGSTFSFDLPFEYDKGVSMKDTVKLSANYNILVVDDNYSARILTQKIFEYLNCTVFTAKDGVDALEKVDEIYKKHEIIDFIVSDFMMPLMNGVELSHEIRKIAKYNKIFFILITAFGKKSELSKKYDCSSIDAYVEKPLKLELIKVLINDLVNESKEKRSNEIKKTQTMMSQTQVLKKSLLGKTVLIVEDNEINLQITEEIISDFNLFYFVAKDGKEALEQYKQKHKSIDAILMDCNMPIMDGFEATKLIRKFEKENDIKDIPIIALSADDPEEVNYLELGMNDFVTKPINIPLLGTTLEKYMNCKLKSESIKKPNKTITSIDKENSKLLSVKGINVLEGLKRVNDNVALYYRLLQDFVLKYADFAEKLIKDINDNKIDNATKATHTLKGVAGNLAITKIAEIVTIMNKNLSKNNLENINELALQLKDELDLFISQFQVELDTTDDTDNEFDYNTIKNELLNIKEMLKLNDFNTEIELTKLINKYPSCKGLPKINSFLREFNFIEAEKLINDLYSL